jgi:FkbM family methyltransferase
MAGRGSFIESFPLFGYNLDDYDDLFSEKLDLLIQLNKKEKISWKGKFRPAINNLGVYPRHLSYVFGTVYCFEPSVELFPMLVANAYETNIIKIQAALGFERGLVGTSRERRDGKTNAHEGITHIDGPGPIPTLQVDDLGLPVCDFIQLDLEGYELYALRGASQTLARCRPVVCVEINKSLGFVGIDEEDVRGFLRGLGYRFVMRLGSDEGYVPEEWGQS